MPNRPDVGLPFSDSSCEARTGFSSASVACSVFSEPFLSSVMLTSVPGCRLDTAFRSALLSSTGWPLTERITSPC